jgi:membrane protein DedA with SNARE-associated domain/rhodanese-related sulfurtransferase
MPRALLLLYGFVVLEALGVPLPAAPALMAAGAASATGKLAIAATWMTAFGALLTGDLILFYLGRRTGWWLLGILCRLSANPETCIYTNASRFQRHGRKALLFAKFFPGVNTLAAPLAGSMNMRFGEFLLFDAMGALFYASFYLALGFLFSPVIQKIISSYENAGRVLSWALLLFVLGYALTRLILNRRAKGMTVPLATPRELAERLGSGEELLVADVRSHGYYDEKSQRITGAIRVEPNDLPSALGQFPKDREIYLYCTCHGDVTSRRVGELLAKEGFQVKVLAGGLTAWKREGHPLEPVPPDDIVKLPMFHR